MSNPQNDSQSAARIAALAAARLNPLPYFEAKLIATRQLLTQFVAVFENPGVKRGITCARDNRFIYADEPAWYIGVPGKPPVHFRLNERTCAVYFFRMAGTEENELGTISFPYDPCSELLICDTPDTGVTQHPKGSPLEVLMATAMRLVEAETPAGAR